MKDDCLISIENVIFLGLTESRHKFEAQLARKFLSSSVLTQISATRMNDEYSVVTFSWQDYLKSANF